MARVRVPLVSDYRARRGLHRMPSWLRAAVGILVLLVSAGLHVAFVVTAFGISRLSSQKTVAHQQVAIEVHERQAKPKEPPPPPKEPEPEVKPERVVPVRQAAQPKVEAQPKEAPKPQLARVAVETDAAIQRLHTLEDERRRELEDAMKRRAQDPWNFLIIAGMWFQDLFNYDFRRTEQCIIPYAT